MSSEGYRSSESREGKPENRKNKSEKSPEKKPKIRTRNRSYERPRNEIKFKMLTKLEVYKDSSSEKIDELVFLKK